MASQAFDGRESGINVSTDERIASALAGGALLLDALLQPSRGRIALAVVGALLLQRGVTGHCHLYQALAIDTARGGKADRRQARRPDAVERASEDSFPASDPPSWTPVKGSVSTHRPASR